MAASTITNGLVIRATVNDGRFYQQYGSASQWQAGQNFLSAIGVEVSEASDAGPLGSGVQAETGMPSCADRGPPGRRCAGAMPWPTVRLADGQGAAARADQCVSLVPGVGDSAGQFQGLAVTPLSLREVTVDPVQRPSLVERIGLTIPVAEVAVDAQSLLQGLGRVITGLM